MAYNLAQYDRPGQQKVSERLPQLMNLFGAAGMGGIQQPNLLQPKSMLPAPMQAGMNVMGGAVDRSRGLSQTSNPFYRPPGGPMNPMGGAGQPPPGGQLPSSGQRANSRFGTMGNMGNRSQRPPITSPNPADVNAYTEKLKKSGGLLGGIRNLMSGIGGKGIDWGSLGL